MPSASREDSTTAMETPVFDSTRPIAINLRTPSGVKTVRVRFPSDDEWIARQRRRKVLVKQLGRGIRDPIQLYAMTTGQKTTGMPGTVTPLSLVETGGSPALWPAGRPGC